MNEPMPAAEPEPEPEAAPGAAHTDGTTEVPEATEATEAAEATEATEAEPVVPDGPRPLGVGVAPTGQPAVDAGLRRLADADHLPSSGHLQVYEDVHRGLREVLAGLDRHPGPPAPSPAPPGTASPTPASRRP